MKILTENGNINLINNKKLTMNDIGKVFCVRIEINEDFLFKIKSLFIET